MLITHEREKLINAIIFFSKNTDHCGKTKLIKLLFLLDFEHFKETGRSVTGQDYYAFELGPVPGSLYEEINNDIGEDLAGAIDIRPEQSYGYTRQTIVPKRDPDRDCFSKRELRILETLAKQYSTHTATQMVEVTHAESGVWDRVFADGEGKYQHIPYELALPEAELPELILEKSKEIAALKAHFETSCIEAGNEKILEARVG